jgi:hypothetical protein
MNGLAPGTGDALGETDRGVATGRDEFEQLAAAAHSTNDATAELDLMTRRRWLAATGWDRLAVSNPVS